MGPSKNDFGVPLGRFAALTAAVVGGNLLLLGNAVPGGPAGIDLYSLKRAEMEARIPAETLFPAVAEMEAAAEIMPGIPETIPFAWFEPPLPAPPPTPGTGGGLDETPLKNINIELLQEWTARKEFDIVFTWGNALLSVPESVLDGAVWGAKALVPPPETAEWRRDGSAGIAWQLMDFQETPRRRGIFSEYLGCWVEREERFFMRFGDSPVDTYGLENGTEEVDAKGLFDEQRKVLWDALRKTVFSKYKVKVEEKLREEALSFRDWRGLDFVLLPPLLAACVYSRGVDRTFSLGATEARVCIEPVWRKARGGEECAAAVGLEWKVGDFPIGLVVTAGNDGDGWGLDFVGVGTGIGVAHRAMDMSRGN